MTYMLLKCFASIRNLRMVVPRGAVVQIGRRSKLKIGVDIPLNTIMSKGWFGDSECCFRDHRHTVHLMVQS